MDALAKQLSVTTAFCERINRDTRIMTICMAEGYTDLTWRKPAGVCGILRFIYTVGVCYGLDETGRRGRFCFDTMQNAQLFLKDWNGVTLPKVGEDGCTAIK